MKRAGQLLLAIVVLVAAAAPWLAPNPPDRVFDDLLYAPPTRLRLLAPEGFGAQASIIYPLRLVSRLERRFEEDRAASRPAAMVHRRPSRHRARGRGRPAAAARRRSASAATSFSRLLYGARASLALAVVSTVLALADRRADRRRGRLRRRNGGRPAVALHRFRAGAAGDLRRAGAARGDAAGAAGRHRVRAARRHLRAARLADRRPRRARDRRVGARARLRDRRPRARRGAVAHPAAPPAAGGAAAISASRRRCCCRRSSSRKRRCRTSASAFPNTCRRGARCCRTRRTSSLLADAPWMLAPAAAIFVVVLAVNLAVQGTGRAPVQLEP